jgi:hypothetical protein
MDNTSIEREALAELVGEAINRAWRLGQTYWQQADSESYRENARSDVTRGKYEDLRTQTLALLAQQPEAVGWVSVKDRLPPAAQTVLVYGRPYGTKQTAHMRVYAAYISTRPREVVEDEQITHWSPLPQPPKDPEA